MWNSPPQQEPMFHSVEVLWNVLVLLPSFAIIYVRLVQVFLQKVGFCTVTMNQTYCLILLVPLMKFANAACIPLSLDVWKASALCCAVQLFLGKIVYLPLPGDDPKQRRPNIHRAKVLLDWQPKAIEVLKQKETKATVPMECMKM